MTTDPKAVYRSFITDVFNGGRLDMIERWLAPSYVYHDAPPGIPTGRDGIRHIVGQFRAAFPDLEISIEEQIGEGGTVCSRTLMRGTHRGSLFGSPASGRRVEMKGITWVRVAEGQVTDSWVRNDVIGLLNQIGALEKKSERPAAAEKKG